MASPEISKTVLSGLKNCFPPAVSFLFSKNWVSKEILPTHFCFEEWWPSFQQCWGCSKENTCLKEQWLEKVCKLKCCGVGKDTKETSYSF